MSNDNNENIITDFSNGKNFRRQDDYNNKEPILICFHGRAFRLKGSIEGILKLIKNWKEQEFEEKILNIRTATGILFSKSLDDIFDHELIEGVCVEKEKYESASNNYIIELCLAILEQFKYKKELKILFADENSDRVDIKSLEPIYWGESGKEYVWDFNDPKGVVHSYLKMPDIYGLYDKIPVKSLDDDYNRVVVIDGRDGEILFKHMQQQRQGELRINKPFFKKYGIGKVGRQVRIRCGFLYPKIRNHLFILEVIQMEKKEENIGDVKDYTFASIKGFQLRMLETGEWNKECPCQYFNDVPPKLCEILIGRHKDFNIENLNERLDGRFFYHGRRGTNPKQIIGTDMFVETNFDNNTKIDLCHRIIKLFGYAETDLRININGQDQDKTEEETKTVNIIKVVKQEDIDIGVKMVNEKDENFSEELIDLQKLKEIIGPEEFAKLVINTREAAEQKAKDDERNADISRIAGEQRIKDDEEKARLLVERTKKERDRRNKIDKNVENLSADAKKAVKNGSLFLEGPPGTSKTYDAEKIVCEIANAYIADKEKDFTFKELKDMGLVDRIELDSSWSSNDLMGGMTYYTEEEDKVADNIKPISKSGILTKMNKRNICLALGLGIEEIESSTLDDIFDKYKERVGDKNIYNRAKRHILLVEEASRGNFESTFGGNMTILESERRLGEDNQTHVTNRLGYCRALAPSMIVVCTRNIADKGAKNIDIGIMRRFPRIYRGPNFKRIEDYMKDNKEKLEQEGICECMKHSVEALQIINNRISAQLGIDYQIGHTYLYVKTKDEFISKWTDWILPSILDRCNRKLDVFEDMLFGENIPEPIDKQKGMLEFENIEDLDNFIIKIIGSEKNE